MYEAQTAVDRFLRAEDGAVTVDWVVLTGALVGLGIATTVLVSGGVENLSQSIADSLSGIETTDWFVNIGALFETDFSEGTGEWTGGFSALLDGFGEVMQIGPGGMAELAIDVPEGAESVTISFDMIGGDDLDGEPATIMIGGQAVAVYSDDHGNITLGDYGVEGIEVSVDQHYSNDPVGAGTHGSDSRATYTIVVSDPAPNLTIGVASGANQGVGNEFYAIDDFSVVAD